MDKVISVTRMPEQNTKTRYHGLSLREMRKAYSAGAQEGGLTEEYAKQLAKEAYPAPKVERPRTVSKQSTVTDSSFQCRMHKGRLLYAYHAGNAPEYDFVKELAEFFDVKKAGETRPALFDDLPLFLDAYAELKANPTEWVDDE